jgi:hypothetical protein
MTELDILSQHKGTRGSLSPTLGHPGPPSQPIPPDSTEACMLLLTRVPGDKAPLFASMQAPT